MVDSNFLACTETPYTCIIQCIIQGLLYITIIQVDYTGVHLYIIDVQVQANPVYWGADAESLL